MVKFHITTALIDKRINPLELVNGHLDILKNGFETESKESDIDSKVIEIKAYDENDKLICRRDYSVKEEK